MSRRIQTVASTQAQAIVELDGGLLLGPATLTDDAPKTSADTAPDNYIARLAKYIPAEVIALYLGVANVVPVTDSSYHLALWIVAGTTALCTPVYMWLATREADKPTLWSQIVISSIAFPIWVFAIGGPFVFLPWYANKHWIAAIVISFVTFLAGAYQPGPDPAAKEPTAT